MNGLYKEIDSLKSENELLKKNKYGRAKIVTSDISTNTDTSNNPIDYTKESNNISVTKKDEKISCESDTSDELTETITFNDNQYLYDGTYIYDINSGEAVGYKKKKGGYKLY